MEIKWMGGARLDWEYDQIMIEFTLLQKFFNKCDYNGLSIPNVHRLRADMIIKLGINALLRADTWSLSTTLPRRTTVSLYLPV